MTSIIASVTIASILLVVYHHAVYPLLLRAWNRRYPSARPAVAPRRYAPTDFDHLLPRVVVLIPVYNEAAVIGDKIRNLAVLDYPPDRLRIVVACDGCRDATAEVARAAAAEPECRHLKVDVLKFAENRGKVALINMLVPAMDTDVIALSDASALVSVDALLIAARHFSDSRVGVVCGTYRLLRSFGAGEASYWAYQTRLRHWEGALGGAIGAHGAFYLFRAHLFRTLPADTINDDFVLPMNIVASGHRAVSDDEMVAIELERATPRQDRRRRRRIAAGNVQQLVRLRGLLHPRFGGTAFAFASGKALRAIMPLLLLLGFAGSVTLARHSPFFAAVAVGPSAACALAVARHALPKRRWPTTIDQVYYVVCGYCAMLIGSCRYILGLERSGWRGPASHAARVSDAKAVAQRSHAPAVVKALKRAIDLGGAIVLLLVALPLIAVAALAIKLDSKGPVFFRQVRVGECREGHVRFIRIVKLRSMRQDAEKLSGAVWASDRDPRVTRVGGVLRRTRLDELPQLWNVLCGEMSLIGPRPERPAFHQSLNASIPFYGERVFGVRPGITGFAQVNLGSDHCLDDVRRKLFFDHAYAIALGKPYAWLRLEMTIVARTIVIMILGPGWLDDAPPWMSVPPAERGAVAPEHELVAPTQDASSKIREPAPL